MQRVQELPLLQPLRKTRWDMRRLQMTNKITLAILAGLSASLAFAEDFKTNGGKEANRSDAPVPRPSASNAEQPNRDDTVCWNITRQRNKRLISNVIRSIVDRAYLPPDSFRTVRSVRPNSRKELAYERKNKMDRGVASIISGHRCSPDRHWTHFTASWNTGNR
jgi:hypothetical protein